MHAIQPDIHTELLHLSADLVRLRMNKKKKKEMMDTSYLLSYVQLS